MARVGELLVARGLVTQDDLRSALDACKRHGGRLGTWLVRLGLVNESALLQALSEQTGCPAATTLELASAPQELRTLLPPAFAKRYLAVAFARRGRNLDVAMANPNDLVVVDEIAALTGLVVRPHVATEASLGAALAIPIAVPPEVNAAPPPGPPRGSAREWRQFWRVESHIQEFSAALKTQPPAAPKAASASFPQLTSLGAGAPPNEAAGLGALAEALGAVSHRDQVAELVISFAAGLAPRTALFSVHQGKAMGWAARGAGIVPEVFHTLILPLDRPSVLLNLAKGVELHSGPLGGGEGNDLLLEALGPPKPTEALIAPVKVRGRVAALLWLDRGSEPAGEIPVAAAREAARLAGLALEVLVLRQKIRGGGRLTEGAGRD